jgi:hypothetical protein
MSLENCKDNYKEATYKWATRQLPHLLFHDPPGPSHEPDHFYPQLAVRCQHNDSTLCPPASFSSAHPTEAPSLSADDRQQAGRGARLQA